MGSLFIFVLLIADSFLNRVFYSQRMIDAFYLFSCFWQKQKFLESLIVYTVHIKWNGIQNSC